VLVWSEGAGSTIRCDSAVTASAVLSVWIGDVPFALLNSFPSVEPSFGCALCCSFGFIGFTSIGAMLLSGCVD
jgi:hypothetical protein